MTASLPTPVSGPLRKLANGTIDCFGTPRPAQIAADTVQGRAVRRVNEVVIQRQGLGSSLGCGLGQTGADRPGQRAGE